MTAVINGGNVGQADREVEDARERFEQALLRAYNEARQADLSTELLGGAGWNHLLIRPAESVFARWLLRECLAFTTENGEVLLPYQGSHVQAAALVHTLIIRVRGLESVEVTSGERPPPSYYEALAQIHGAQRPD
jgi:hypothetical protein